MSIRRSPQLSPRLLDAARSNARRSHGPCTAAGKQHSKMNALKHGERSDPGNHYEVMRALGEDPAEFDALKQGLKDSFGPGDAFFDKQIDDLARLYWRRNRIERMVTGLMRDALEEVEKEQRQLARALAAVTFDPSQCDAVALDLPQPRHPCVRLRMLISLWGVIREQVRRRVFTYEQQRRIESYYQGQVGWRPRQICHLLLLFGNRACLQEKQDQAELNQYVKDAFGGEAGVETRYQELERLLEEEMGAVEAAFAEEMAAQEKLDAIARDARLAPEDKTAEMVLRQETALDRAIDRKIKLLLTLRKSSTGARACAGVSTGGGLEAGKSACPTPEATKASSTGTPACAEKSMAGGQDAGEPQVAAPAGDECGTTNELPSPLGRGCQAPAVSSAGA